MDPSPPDPRLGDDVTRFEAVFAAAGGRAQRRRAWKRLAAALHPDRHGGHAGAAARFVAAREAYRRAEARAGGESAPRQPEPATSAFSQTHATDTHATDTHATDTHAAAYACPVCEELWSFPLACPRCDVTPHASGPAIAERDAAVDAWVRALSRPPRMLWPEEAVLRRGLAATLGVLACVQLTAGLRGLALFTLSGLLAFAGLRASEAWAARRTRRWAPATE